MPLLLSIIVPVYNVEKYLANCLESILVQTFIDFELILVNDGSTDKSEDICNFFKNRDKRIKVISKLNSGVSSTRNTGIEISKGEYIAFVDPDDTVEPNMYEVLLKTIIEHDADMVVCPINRINLITNTTSISSIWNRVNRKLNKQIIEEQIIPSILLNKDYSLISSVNKIYKKSLFNSLNLRFDESMHHSEDARLNFTLLTKLNNLVYVEQPFYNYYIRERDSLSKVFNENLYNYILNIKNFLLGVSKKYNIEKYENSIKNHFTSVTLGHMHDVVFSDITKYNKFKILFEITNDKEFMEDIKLYKSPSIYYKILKTICIKRYVGAFFYLAQTRKLLNL